jgi:SAM-dependent methyltransferase
VIKCLTHRVKPIIRAIVPSKWRQRLHHYRCRRWDAKFQKQPPGNVFAAIYKEAKWGADPQGEFYSGSGSHDAEIISPYVEAVNAFLQCLPSPPSVVDLGCGDFNVGSRLRPYCGNYVACDVVPDLIRRNRIKFSNANVDFRCLDITADDLPVADIVILRQVLQHLSNAQILKVVSKLSRFRSLILTEHLSTDPGFRPNVDTATGAMVRVMLHSGVVLTQDPFNLKVRYSEVMCSVIRTIDQCPGQIGTIRYQL